MDIKKEVRKKYAAIVTKDQKDGSCGCSCGCGDNSIFGIEYSVFNEDYKNLDGYNADADLALGCGLPTEHAAISAGDTVVDLGSGAGNDCFVARAICGESGRVIGLDFTPEMVAKARINTEKRGFTNIEFIEGDIEQMPIESGIADVVISNCVLNLVPDKTKAFAEIFRILKHRGHFCISDIVIVGDLPEAARNDMALYAGCISGAVQKEEYLGIIEKAGFENIRIKKDRPIDIPEEILIKYLNNKDIDALKASKTGIFSITVYAEKPGIVTSNNYNYQQD
jgi:SAM-dependent methyltransferase